MPDGSQRTRVPHPIILSPLDERIRSELLLGEEDVRIGAW